MNWRGFVVVTSIVTFASALVEDTTSGEVRK